MCIIVAVYLYIHTHITMYIIVKVLTVEYVYV